MKVKVSCVKADKARILTRQDTVYHELDKVEGTRGRAYISGITDAATSDGGACTIWKFLLRSDLTHKHGVES